MIKIQEGDARTHEFGTKADLVFLDPPQKQGPNCLRETLVTYHEQVFRNAIKHLKCPGVLVCCTIPEYTHDYRLILESSPLTYWHEVIWNFNFGMSNRNRFTPAHMTCLIYKYGSPSFDWTKVAIPSQRLKAGDKRGDARGKTPGTVWSDNYLNSVWEIAKLPGNATERIGPDAQLPVKLVYGLIKPFVNRGGTVIDPMCGYGTIPEICRIFQLRCHALDIDEKKVRLSKLRMKRNFSLDVSKIY